MDHQQALRSLAMSDAPARPEHTEGFAPSEGELDAGLFAAFDGDSDPPLAVGASVLQALEAAAPGSVRRVQLRTPDDDPPTPINLPASEQMPQTQDFPSRYQLVGEIARGGMGAIFKGRDTDLGRDIAVKMMLETHKGRTEMLQRFVEEAQIGGQLQHPGIVPVYELNQTRDRRPYFTMKLVKGQTLTTLLKQRSDPQHELPRFLGIFEQVCRTLAYAHARGVIHRDLKPSNIMVGNFGEIQVMDWGLAKVLQRADSGDELLPEEATVIHTARSESSSPSSLTPAVVSGSQTAAGSILGTPAYMAPEQARGEVDSLDERCDVFGLGAILCQILTGQPPYVSTGRVDLLQQARQAALDAALARLDACGADATLIALTKQCLQANQDDRPRDAGVVSEAVTGYLESVQARLKQAELDRAAALARADEEQRRRQAEQGRAAAEQARADEEQRRRQAEQAKVHTERQRRRLTVALATAVVLLVAGAGAAGWWYQHEQLAQAEQRQQREAEESKRQVAEAAQRAQQAAQLRDERDRAQMALTHQVAGRLDGEVQQLAVVGDSIVAALALGPDFNQNQLRSLMKNLLNKDHRIHGLTLAYQPEKGPNKCKHDSLYLYRTPKEIVQTKLPRRYDYPRWDWYKKPIDTRKSHWSGPSFDEPSNAWMVGYSVPMWRDHEENLVGVLCVDLELGYFDRVSDWLKELNPDKKKKSYGFVVNGKGFTAGKGQNTEGVFLSHPEYGAGKTADRPPKKITEVGTEDPEFTKLTQHILNGKTGRGTATDPATGKRSTFLFTPVPSTGWSFVAVIED
jgi:hypothetical protein